MTWKHKEVIKASGVGASWGGSFCDSVLEISCITKLCNGRNRRDKLVAGLFHR